MPRDPKTMPYLDDRLNLGARGTSILMTPRENILHQRSRISRQPVTIKVQPATLQRFERPREVQCLIISY
jgi:hypothetical protein